MSQTTMYTGKNNSPRTTLAAAISASETTIALTSVAGLPAAPNICTIGTGDSAEVIRYGAISGTSLTGCERGFGGTTASVWGAETVLYRGITLYDISVIQDNIRDLASGKLAADGEGSNLTVAAEIAEARNNITSGETLASIIGKIMKFYNDVKALAYKQAVSTDDIEGSAISNAKLASMGAASIKGNAGNSAAAPADLSAAQVRAMINVADGADATGAAIEAIESVDAIANEDKIVLVDASETAGSRTKYVIWSALKSALNAFFVPQTRAVNGKALDTNISLTASDIGAKAAPATATSLPASGTALTPNSEYRVTQNVGTYTFAWPPAPFEVWIYFTTATTHNITFPPGTKYIGGAPTFSAQTPYEMSIKDGVVAVQEVVTS